MAVARDVAVLVGRIVICKVINHQGNVSFRCGFRSVTVEENGGLY